MRRWGQSVCRARAVEPPTLPVPPSIRILESFTFSGSWTLSMLVLLLRSPFSLAEAIARFLAMPAFNCRQNLAIFLSRKREGQRVFFWVISLSLLIALLYTFSLTHVSTPFRNQNTGPVQTKFSEINEWRFEIWEHLVLILMGFPS